MKAFAYTREYLDRNRRILKLVGNGWSYAKIGRKLGITRERVRQIVKAAGQA